MVASIRVERECSVEVGEGKYGWLGEGLFECVEGLLVFWRPFEPGVFSHEAMQWGCNFCEIFHEPAVVACQTYECTNVLYCPRRRVLGDFFDVFRIRVYAFSRNNVTEVLSSLLCKLALLGFDLQVVELQTCKDVTQPVQVLLKIV